MIYRRCKISREVVKALLGYVNPNFPAEFAIVPFHAEAEYGATILAESGVLSPFNVILATEETEDGMAEDQIIENFDEINVRST